MQCIGFAPHFCCVARPYPQVCHTKPGVEQCCAGLHLHQTTTEIGRMLASDVRGDTLRLGIQRSSGTWPQTHTQTQAFRNRNLPYRYTTTIHGDPPNCWLYLKISTTYIIYVNFLKVGCKFDVSFPLGAEELQALLHQRHPWAPPEFWQSTPCTSPLRSR